MAPLTSLPAGVSDAAVPVLDDGAQAPTDDRIVSVSPPSMATVARGLSWTVIGRVAGQGSWYASLLTLAILVPPGAFGVVAVGSVIVAITTLLMESGTGGTIVVTPNVSSAYLRRSVIRTGIAGITLSALAALLAGPIMRLFAHGGNPDVLRVMVGAVALAALSIVPMALLKKTLHFKRQALVMIGAAILASAASIVAGALGAGVWALVIRIVLYQALVTVFAWLAVLDLLPRIRAAGRPAPLRRPSAQWFMTIALAGFVAQTFDNLIVGHFTNVTQLGLYAMAFSLGLAPTMQVSWQLGGVLFPVIAATRDLRQVAQRTLKSMRLMSLLLLPVLPPAIVLAPTLIASVLPHKWAGMVAPFQVLILVGVVQGILNVLAESLAASGGVATRARIDATWAATTVGVLIVGTELWGIRGAAFGHVVMLAFAVAAYLRWGAPRVGLSASQVVGAVGGAGAAVAVQGAVTLGLVLGLKALGTGAPIAAAAAGLGGFVAFIVVLPRTAPGLGREAREVVSAAIRSRRG